MSWEVPEERDRRLTDAMVLIASRWYLVFTKPSSEEKARANLERQGYRVYFPRLLERKIYRGRWRERISALFPRYLFVQARNVGQSLSSVRSTVGVAEAVRFGSNYAVVPEQVVNGLVERADPHTGLHLLKRSTLSPGDAVRVVSGAFVGLEGLFARESGAERVLVLLKLLQREAAVSLPLDCVVAGCS